MFSSFFGGQDSPQQHSRSAGKRKRELDDDEGRRDELLSQNARLASEKEALGRKVRALEDRIVRLEQGQDYRSRTGTEGTIFDHVVNLANGLSQMLDDWSEKVCASISQEIEVEEHVFRLPQMLNVCSEGMTQAKVQRMGISLNDLLTAVASDYLYTNVIAKPMNLCIPKFKEELESHLWKRLSRENGRVAKAAEAACLALYDARSTESWEPYFSSPRDRTRAERRFIKLVCREIAKAIGQIGDFDLVAAEKELVGAAEAASRLSKILGKVSSGHEVLDKAWLRGQSQAVRPSDGRLRLLGTTAERLGVSDITRCDFVILTPGILKWGRETGESWETWDVYAGMSICTRPPDQ